MRIACLLLLSATLAACHSHNHWYKGNTHTHSFWSDGNDFPEMIALWYRDHGYDFLVLSDHNILSQGEKWMKVSEVDRRSGGAAMGKYIARLGESSVERRGEGADAQVRLKTLDEVRELAESPGKFIMIQGEEISDHFENRPIHTNAMNLGELVPPPGGSSVREVMRNSVLAVEEQARRLGRPILPHLNHPNFGYAITAEDLAHVLEEEFFEVYNGHPGVGHMGDDVHPPVERLWDIANTIRIAELHAPPLYGVATDDSHHYHEGPRQTVTPGKGWIMVRARRLDAASLIHAMRHGDFYASSGVTLAQIHYDGKALTVEVEPETGVQYTIDFIGTLRGYDATVEPRTHPTKGHAITGRYSDDVGRVLMSAPGTGATYVLRGDELYVRARIRASRPPANPSYEGQVAEAWTQPVGWERHVDPQLTRRHFHRH
jgi:hypothetical protein